MVAVVAFGDELSVDFHGTRRVGKAPSFEQVGDGAGSAKLFGFAVDGKLHQDILAGMRPDSPRRSSRKLRFALASGRTGRIFERSTVLRAKEKK